MKRTSALPSRSRLILALAAAAASGAALAQVNPTAVVLERLKQSSAKQAGDGAKLTAVKLKGDMNTDGIRFVLPTVIPEKPLVLMQQRLTNCNDREVTGHAGVNKSTENSESFSKATTLGGETSVSVSYDSPIGLGGSATQSFNYSTTSTEEKTHTETVGWDQGIDVPVGPKQALTVQFVVGEQKLDNIPWSTNVIVSGAAELTYVKDPGQATLCAYEHTGHGGKKKCWTTTGGKLKVARFKDVDWDGGGGNINDEITGFTLRGNAKVTFYQNHDFDGWSADYTSSDSNVGADRNDRFSSVVIEPRGSSRVVTENLEKYLNDQQRRIALKGTYKGVNGVQGEFRAGAPVTLRDSDCGLVVAAASTSAASTKAPTASKATAGTQAAQKASVQAPQKVMVQAAVVAPNTAPLAGRVLAKGIKPSSKQVVKTSVKK